MATLAHALQIVGSFIAPLVIFLIRRDSRFVTFHALQAILWQVFFIGVAMVLVVAMMIGIFLTMPASGGHRGEPPAFIFLFPLIWLTIMAGNLTTIVLAIVYAIKAGKGEWANYPLLGRLARRLLGH